MAPSGRQRKQIEIIWIFDHLSVVIYLRCWRQVRHAWARYVQKSGWGLEVRATIYLRQLYDREPTKDEVSLALTKEEIAHKTKYKNITPQEVERAYDEGKQVFLVPIRSFAFLVSLDSRVAQTYATIAPRYLVSEVRRLRRGVSEGAR